MQTHLRRSLQWTEAPLIVNAPMSGFARVELAVAVTRAGGLGQIGFIDNVTTLAKQLHTAQELLADIGPPADNLNLIPVGVGVIVFGAEIDAWIEVLTVYKPVVLWLFAADRIEDYQVWAQAIRHVSPHTKIWIQLGSVDAALKAAQLCCPDGIVMQGSDAGGHGNRYGASIVSLIPETREMLQRTGFGATTSLLAAGGITDGRGVAGALALGADGVVMGTRFLAAHETHISQIDRAAVLAAHDGGQATVRTHVFDEMMGPNIWPEIYDGRGLINQAYRDSQEGVSGDEIRRRFRASLYHPGDTPWNVIWAGTGVGLVNQLNSAQQIVREVRADARHVLAETVSSFGEP